MIRTAIKFGLFVAACLFFTGWLAFTIGNIQLFADRYTLTARFDDVTGLLVNDNVKIAGVPVGKVTGIDVDDGEAEVTFEVNDRYELPTDSAAAVRWRNLIGQRYLYVIPGTASTVLEDGGTIESTDSVVQLGELFNKLGPIVAAIDEGKVNEFLTTVSEALNGNEARLSTAIDDLASVAATLATRDEAIGSLVENLNTVTGTIADRDEQIRVMLDNLVLLSQAFSDNTGLIDEALVEFGDFSASLDAILNNNASEIDRLIANLDLVVQTLGSRLGNIDSALAGLPAAAESVFRSSRLGEWLNQDILCAAIGPPSPSSVCPPPIQGVGDILGGLGNAPIGSSTNAPSSTTTSSSAPAGPSGPTVTDLDPVLSGLDPVISLLTGGGR